MIAVVLRSSEHNSNSCADVMRTRHNIAIARSVAYDIVSTSRDDNVIVPPVDIVCIPESCTRRLLRAHRLFVQRHWRHTQTTRTRSTLSLAYVYARDHSVKKINKLEDTMPYELVRYIDNNSIRMAMSLCLDSDHNRSRRQQSAW